MLASATFVRGKDTDYMLMKTEESLDLSELSEKESDAMTKKLKKWTDELFDDKMDNQGMSFEEASAAIAEETAAYAKLAYYEGIDGVFQRVYP